MMNNILESIEMWWLARKRKKAKEETMKETGWESTCRKCGRLYFTDKSGTFICDSITHWHYSCVCGDKVKYLLTIMPVLDGDSNAVIRRVPYMDLGDFYILSDEDVVRDSKTDDVVCKLTLNDKSCGMPDLQLEGDDHRYCSYDSLRTELYKRFTPPTVQLLNLGAKSTTEPASYIRLEKQFDTNVSVSNLLIVFAYYADGSVVELNKNFYVVSEVGKYLDVVFHNLDIIGTRDESALTKFGFLVEV